MNAVHLVGKIATDIRLQDFTRSDGEIKTKASFIIAVPRRVKDGPPDWIRIEAWGGQARNLPRFNRKGSRIAVDGRVRGEFFNRDGGTRGGELRLVVVAEGITYLTPPKTTAEEDPVSAAKAKTR